MTVSYEVLLNSTTFLKRKRFAREDFTGAQLSERWEFKNIQGTNSGAIVDAINGGYEITTGSNLNDRASIYFNSIRQFDFESSVVICTMKYENSSQVQYCGLSASDRLDTASVANISVNVDTLLSNYGITSSTGSSGSNSQSSLPRDANFHDHKIIASKTDIRLFIDTALEVVKTTNRPTGNANPCFENFTRTGASKIGTIRYYEAYNL